jgi:hypothetical protein
LEKSRAVTVTALTGWRAGPAPLEIGHRLQDQVDAADLVQESFPEAHRHVETRPLSHQL